jgi:16S rRNA (uracil1498-N3)-methyltransferase
VASPLRSLGSGPAFFLASTMGVEPVRLDPEDERHALRVLRLGEGDGLVGLDGRGGRWPLRVRSAGKVLEIEPAGEVEHEPPPGAEGAACPWFELAIAWPRRNRVEDMLGRLVQLGAAGIVPLLASHRGPEAVPEEPPDRWWRVAHEACKQSRRSWLPEIGSTTTPVQHAEARADSPVALLDPRAGLSFDVWLRSLQPSPLGIGTAERPIVLVVGPEGGFDAEERGAWLERGATAVCLGPHVLRVETAAEAAMAVAAAVHSRPPGRAEPRGSWPEES